MKVQPAYIADPFASIGIVDIQRFEKDVHIVLPDSYRRFLLENNGGYFCNWPAYVGQPDSAIYAIDMLYGINVPFRYGDLFDSLRSFRYVSSLKESWLPIGSDPYGNWFCIRGSSRSHSEVFFYDHETDDIEEQISPSIEEFLNNLFTTNRNENETNNFFQSIEVGDLDAIEETISQDTYDPDIRSSEGFTPLGYATFYLQPRSAAILLKYKSKVNELDLHGCAPLHWATGDSMVEMLLKAGADIELRACNGETPFLSSLRRSHQNVCIYLLSHGANYAVRDYKDNDYSSYIEYNEDVKTFMEKNGMI